MLKIKNPIFIKNMTYPDVDDEHKGKIVTKILHNKISKIGREVEQLVWETYKSRGNTSVDEVLKKFRGIGRIKVIFSGDPIIYEIDNAIKPKKGSL